MPLPLSTAVPPAPLRHRGDRQRVAVDVGVVAQQLRRRVGHRRVLGRRQRVIAATGASLTAATLTVTVAGVAGGRAVARPCS